MQLCQKKKKQTNVLKSQDTQLLALIGQWDLYESVHTGRAEVREAGCRRSWKFSGICNTDFKWKWIVRSEYTLFTWLLFSAQVSRCYKSKVHSVFRNTQWESWETEGKIRAVTNAAGRFIRRSLKEEIWSPEGISRWFRGSRRGSRRAPESGEKRNTSHEGQRECLHIFYRHVVFLTFIHRTIIHTW